MGSRRALERRLSAVEGFDDPTVSLEQYLTPADVASSLIHVADTQDDLTDRTVIDLGTGTGMLALGAACHSPMRVVGIERDRTALATARENEQRVDPPVDVEWVHGDATRPPLCTEDATVLSNPPFGAQRGSEGADRAFLATASALGAVSYTIHNEGSQEFVEAFAADWDGTVTHAFGITLTVPRQFEFHDRERADLPAEAYRIEWG